MNNWTGIDPQQWESEARCSLEKMKPLSNGCMTQMLEFLRYEKIPYSELEARVKEYRELYPCLFFAKFP